MAEVENLVTVVEGDAARVAAPETGGKLMRGKVAAPFLLSRLGWEKVKGVKGNVQDGIISALPTP